jgi:hypothetical protein
VKAPKTVTRAVADRLGNNNRTSVFRASVTAVAVGGAVGAAVYRVLRN